TEGPIRIETRREGKCAVGGVPKCRDVRSCANVWELVCSRDSKGSASRVHSRHRVAQIVVLDERCVNQLLELGVLEQLKPFEISQGSQVGWRHSIGAASKDIRRLDVRSTVFRANHTAS